MLHIAQGTRKDMHKAQVQMYLYIQSFSLNTAILIQLLPQGQSFNDVHSIVSISYLHMIWSYE